MNALDDDFQRLLDEAAGFHGHLCAGQALGVRMAMTGLRELAIDSPRGRQGRDLIIFVECDRCPTDAIIAVTGRTPGKRSIKMMDYGKMAATFFDAHTGNAVRVSVRADSDERIRRVAQDCGPRSNEKEARLAALKNIAEEDLLRVERVSVALKPQDFPGEPLDSIICAKCGETVKDLRQVSREGQMLCRPCAQGSAYYTAHRDVFPCK